MVDAIIAGIVGVLSMALILTLGYLLYFIATVYKDAPDEEKFCPKCGSIRRDA